MNRAERRRQARGHRHLHVADDSDYSVVTGWAATEADLEEAKKGTHDVLIGLMGDRRAGGVRWLIYSGEDAQRTLGRLFDGASAELCDHYRRIGAHLREYGGFLVAAMAEGRR